MIQEIYIIDDDESSLPVFEKLFIEEKDFKFIGVKTEQIDIALKNIPFLIVINEDAIDRDVVGLCKKIRTDEDNQITPIIIVSSNTKQYYAHFLPHIYVENSALSVCFLFILPLVARQGDISSIQPDGVDRAYIGCICHSFAQSFTELPFTTD